MKKPSYLVSILLAASLISAFGQPQSGRGGLVLGGGFGNAETSSAYDSTNLTKFNLDFPGGTPRQLITAIEKAMGKPVNAIIPAEHADVKLPPLKMANVNVAQLFQALELMSQKTEPYVTGGGGGYAPLSYQFSKTSFGFRAQGTYSDDSIWYFYVDGLPKTPFESPVVSKICRFYPLTSYLDRGITVDDITTAIQTGWKMLGDKETPAISFHKETKLLIAVGEPAKLETIDAVLKSLTPTSGDAFTDRMNSIMQKAGAGVSPPPVNLPPLPGKFPRTLKTPEAPQTEN